MGGGSVLLHSNDGYIEPYMCVRVLPASTLVSLHVVPVSCFL